MLIIFAPLLSCHTLDSFPLGTFTFPSLSICIVSNLYTSNSSRYCSFSTECFVTQNNFARKQ